MLIASVGRALPPHRYEQDELIRGFEEAWGRKFRNAARVAALHRAVEVRSRYLALPMEDYPKLQGFEEANDVWIRCAVKLGEAAVRDALDGAGLTPSDVDHLFFTTVTGLAVPSIDARLVSRLGLRRDVKRTPMYGLGCVAGAVGITRAADYLRAFPDQVAVLLSVELCSLTLQKGDIAIANLIAAGLFGDGAAAVVMTGEERTTRGIRVVATRSVFFEDTEHVMGWRITDGGFKVVLSADVPDIARGLRPDVDGFLAEQGLRLGDIDRFICHPGGPKVIQALEEGLSLPDGAVELTRKSLAEVGNLSSASVLFVLGDTMAQEPKPGSRGLLLAMGPGFCAELVLLEWESG